MQFTVHRDHTLFRCDFHCSYIFMWFRIKVIDVRYCHIIYITEKYGTSAPTAATNLDYNLWKYGSQLKYKENLCPFYWVHPHDLLLISHAFYSILLYIKQITILYTLTLLPYAKWYISTVIISLIRATNGFNGLMETKSWKTSFTLLKSSYGSKMYLLWFMACLNVILNVEMSMCHVSSIIHLCHVSSINAFIISRFIHGFPSLSQAQGKQSHESCTLVVRVKVIAANKFPLLI